MGVGQALDRQRERHIFAERRRPTWPIEQKFTNREMAILDRLRPAGLLAAGRCVL
jgi:hypothetical protein